MDDGDGPSSHLAHLWRIACDGRGCVSCAIALGGGWVGGCLGRTMASGWMVAGVKGLVTW